MDAKEKIAALLKKRGWSKRHLAKEAGINASTVYNWYNERNNEPSKKAIDDVCAAFDITLSEFFSDVEVDKLTDKELKILEAFRQVPDKKKDTVIAMVEAFKE